MGRKGENIFHRKDGRWEARYIKGYSVNGKKEYGYLYGKTYHEVKTKRINRLLNFEQENCKNKRMENQITMNKKINQWLEEQKISVKISTFSYYASIIEHHIRPFLGDFLVNDIKNEDITKFIAQKLAAGRLKASTIKEIVIVLKRLLVFCNLSFSIAIPKTGKSEILILTKKDQERLENYIINNQTTFNIGILLSLYMGLRIGELCALTWKDIDLNAGIVRIKSTVARVKNIQGKGNSKTIVTILEAKTNHSIRKIPLSDDLIFLLNKLKCTEEDCHFLSNTRKIVDTRTYYNYFKKVQKICKLDDDYTYHALRHTFATNCIALGLDPKSLSELLGHSNINTTLSLYVHPDLKEKRTFLNQKMKFLNSSSKN